MAHAATSEIESCAVVQTASSPICARTAPIMLASRRLHLANVSKRNTVRHRDESHYIGEVFRRVFLQLCNYSHLRLGGNEQHEKQCSGGLFYQRPKSRTC